MRKGLLIISAAVCLSVILLGFLSKGACADRTEPIVIGVPTSLYTAFGRDGLNALKLAVTEMNERGGVLVGTERRPFKVVVADTRGGEPVTSVDDALMAYEEMLSKRKPHAIMIGALRSEVLIASMDLVAKYKVPHIGTIAQTPKFQTKFESDPERFKYLFRATTDALVPATYISHTLDILKNEFGLDRTYLIYQDTLWAKAFAGLMRAHCQKTGWTELGYDPYAADASDFSPALTRAKEGKAQVIAMVWDVPLGAGIFVKQYVAMKVPALLIGFIPPVGSSVALRTVGPEVEYSLTVEFPVGASLPLKKLPRTTAFLAKFKERYGALPEPPAVNSSAYDAVYVLAAAIERARSLDADQLVAALEKTDYQGVSGRVRFNENHIMVFGEEDPNETGVAVVFQWQKGEDGELRRVPVYPAFLAEGRILLPPWMRD
jgi:branched-chain amino acid transport system substrate-binding protein